MLPCYFSTFINNLNSSDPLFLHSNTPKHPQTTKTTSPLLVFSDHFSPADLTDMKIVRDRAGVHLSSSVIFMWAADSNFTINSHVISLKGSLVRLRELESLVWPPGACEEMVLILPQAKHCQQDLTLQNNFPITFWHAYWHKRTKL